MLQRNEQLLTARLVLKSIQEKDQIDMLEIIKNPQVKMTYMLPDFSSQEEGEKIFLKLMNLSLNKEKFVYGIYSKNKIIGFFNEVTKQNKTIEIGYFISPNEWNKGYATEALKAAIEELFRIGYQTVEAAHFENNLASARVMQKAGMVRINKEEIVEYRHTSHRCLFYQITRKK